MPSTLTDSLAHRFTDTLSHSQSLAAICSVPSLSSSSSTNRPVSHLRRKLGLFSPMCDSGLFGSKSDLLFAMQRRHDVQRPQLQALDEHQVG